MRHLEDARELFKKWGFRRIEDSNRKGSWSVAGHLLGQDEPASAGGHEGLCEAAERDVQRLDHPTHQGALPRGSEGRSSDEWPVRRCGELQETVDCSFLVRSDAVVSGYCEALH